MAKRKSQPRNLSPRIENRRALHDYFVRDRVECGIALQGSEVKAIRLGRATLQESFARVEPRTEELYLYNVDIGQYPQAGVNQHEPQRPRKLLAHKNEIRRLLQETQGAGTTLIPLVMYFKHGMIKVEVGVCEGKRQQDKRQDLKKKQADRDIRRAMTRKVLR